MSASRAEVWLGLTDGCRVTASLTVGPMRGRFRLPTARSYARAPPRCPGLPAAGALREWMLLFVDYITTKK